MIIKHQFDAGYSMAPEARSHRLREVQDGALWPMGLRWPNRLQRWAARDLSDDLFMPRCTSGTSSTREQ